MSRLETIPRQILFATLAAALMLSAGCEEPAARRTDTPTGRRIPPTVEIRVVSDMTELTPDSEPFENDDLLSADGKTVRLAAAANETTSFQIGIDAPRGGLSEVRLTPGEWTLAGQAATPSPLVRLFRMSPVEPAALPAWYLRLVDRTPDHSPRYDILTPLDPSPSQPAISLSPGERLAVWADVSVPRNASPGVYRGAIRIQTGLMEGCRFDVELTVHDFVLPDVRPVAAVGGFSHEAIFRQFVRRGGKPYVPARLDADDPALAEGLALWRELVALAHEHRLDLFDKSLRPRLRRDLQGRWKLDWRSYDRLVQPLLDGSAFADRTGVAAWAIPFHDAWPTPQYYGGFDAPAYRAAAAEIIAACGRHFRDLGAEEQIFAWPYRNEAFPSATGPGERLAEILHQADAGIPVLAMLPPPEKPHAAPKPFDIFAPSGRMWNPAPTTGPRNPSRPLEGVWLVPGDAPYVPSLSLIASPSDIRALPWFAMKYSCTGLFLPEVLHWNSDAFAPPAGEEIRLFYPDAAAGRPRILPSVRLKRLRRGLQDLACLWILQEQGREALARAIRDAMVRYGGLEAVGDHPFDPPLEGWVKDGGVWNEAGRLLAEEVRQAVHPTERTESDRIADQVRWRHFTERTSSIAVERVQAFVRGGELPLTDIPSDARQNIRNLRVTLLASLYNEFNRPLDVKARIASLPEGWRRVVGEYFIPRFPAGGRRDARLVAEGLDVPVTPDGKMPFVLEISAEPNTYQLRRVETAFLVAGRFHTPPVLDGKLDDWPLRPRAAAGNFRLLGRQGQILSAEGGSRGLARRATVAFAMQDAQNLYFAFRCEEPNPSGMIVRNDNFVRYDQLLARGEDLVELLLDPGAKAAGPEDLYHILVKPSAVNIQEIGVSADPPVGRTRPFPLGAKVAVSRQEKFWSVEIAIPRRAFGAEANEPFWGVNFTRFTPQGPEASSWSGASRHFYDPRTLGTMYVPPPQEMENSLSPAVPVQSGFPQEKNER